MKSCRRWLWDITITSSNPHDFEEVVQFTKRVVTEDMNSSLIRNFSKEEVEIALKQMPLWKRQV